MIPIIQQPSQNPPMGVQQKAITPSMDKLPVIIINQISNFSEKLTNAQLVCKKWNKLFTNDQTLILKYSEITDEELIQVIEKRKDKITEINISNCSNISNSTIKYISTLKNLKKLSLNKCSYYINDKSIKEVSNLKNLEKLSLDCDITDESVKKLSNLNNLTDLILKSDRISNAGIKELSNLKNLKNFGLDCCITNKIVKDLSNWKNLKELRLNDKNSSCHTVGFKNLSNLENLTVLDLNSNAITSEDIENFSKLQHLEMIHLSAGELMDEDTNFENLLRLKSLKSVQICGPSHLPILGNGLAEIDHMKRIYDEMMTIKQFIQEKSPKFNIASFTFKLDPKNVAALSRGLYLNDYEIYINPLYLITNMDIDLFLLQNKNHQENVTKFLTQKSPELLEQAAIDLIAHFNKNCPSVDYKIPLNKLNIPRNRLNIILAKEFLVWHALGKFTEAKRFILEHELGHTSDFSHSKSLGEFDPCEFDFIKPNQFIEVRADLSAAREANAHEVGIMIFEWQNILSRQPDEDALHPTDANRAKVLKIDWEKRQKSKTAS